MATAGAGNNFTMRKLRRLVRTAGMLPWAYWAWQHRRSLASWAGFARALPDRLRAHGWRDVVLEVRARLALDRHPALQKAPVEVGSVSEATVTLFAPSADGRTGIARSVVESIPGVLGVRLIDPASQPLGTQSAPPARPAADAAFAGRAS